MKKLLLLLLATIPLFIFCTKKQAPEKYQTLATIGESKITLTEFQHRFEFTPKIYRYGNDTENKKHFLASLLSEKLLAQLAREQNLDTLTEISAFTQQIQKEAIIEALFDEEVTQKIKIPESEIRKGFIRSKQELKLRFFKVTSQDEAELAGEQLTAGEAFDKVAATWLFHNSAHTDSVPYKILKWGEAMSAVEDSVFNLKQNEFTGPIKVEKEYYFFKLVDKKSEAFLTENDYNYWRPSIEKRIRRQLRSKMFSELIGKIMQDKKVVVPRKKFEFLVKALEDILDIQEEDNSKPNVQKSQQLIKNDYGNIRSELKDYFNEPFANFSDGSVWTVGDFLEKLKVGPYPLKYENKRQFRASLRHAIRFMIELEQLAEEGEKRGLGNSAFVQEETRMWQDSFLAGVMRQKIILDCERPTAEDYKNFYQENPKKYMRPELINIQEILVDDEVLAQELMKQIKAGKNVAALARKYSKRELSAHKGGISGYFKPEAFGKVGAVALQTSIGELAGPVKTEKNQYSIFKLIDKKARQPRPYEDVKGEVQQEYLKQYIDEQMSAFLCGQSSNYDIQIDKTALDTLKVIDQGTGLFVLKQHFPGRSAVPLVQPADLQTDWQKRVKQIIGEN